MLDLLGRLTEVINRLLDDLYETTAIDLDEVENRDQAYRLGIRAARATLGAWLAEAEGWADLDEADPDDVRAAALVFCPEVCPASRPPRAPGEHDLCGRCPLRPFTVDPTRRQVASLDQD